MRAFNDDMTRVITDEEGVFGAAIGYWGEVVDGKFDGHHAGVFQTIESAEAWLRGEGEPDLKMPYSTEAP